MRKTTIPDEVLLGEADLVTVWVATPDAPSDIWSLADALAWVMRQPDRRRIMLFRPPGGGASAAWVGPDQIERLALALAADAAAA